MEIVREPLKQEGRGPATKGVKVQKRAICPESSQGGHIEWLNAWLQTTLPAWVSMP